MSERQYDYDVFISYSSKDRVWVRSELLSYLEAASLRACIDFRDFQIGAPTVTEIERAVLTSRKTLLILTPAYLASQWAEFENIMLQTLDPANRERRLIPLLKEHCDLPLRINYLTYVDFTDPNNLDLAWRKLLNALGATQAGLPQMAPSTKQIQAGVGTGTNIRNLHKQMLERCSVGDIKDVCFALNIDYDNYPGGKSDFIRDLLADLQRQGRVEEFVKALREEKPWVLA